MTDSCFVGIDFGTTNSALAIASPDGSTQLAQFSFLGNDTHLFRSVIYFSYEERDSFGRAASYAGPEAIARYLEEDGNGRLLISPKSSLASKLFDKTQVLYDQYKHEQLVAIILRNLLQHAKTQFPNLGKRVVAGRPVHFAGAKTAEDEALALSRLTTAFQDVGFEEIHFEYEPVAAAAAYEASLTRNERVLVADFGGGTTDFCIIQVGPNSMGRPQEEKILTTHGIGIAGDNFDSRIVSELIAPAFGKGTEFRSEFSRMLPVPTWPYGHLSRWYLVSFLSEPKTLDMLHGIHRRATEPDKIQAFLDFIEGNLGFHLYRTVEQSKIELSSHDESQFRFNELTRPFEAAIPRTSFESWINPEIEKIAACCDETLAQANLTYADIDRVFMTGGTSFVPAVRQLFLDRFGEEKMGRGHELTSVASGLARRALEHFSA